MENIFNEMTKNTIKYISNARFVNYARKLHENY